MTIEAVPTRAGWYLLHGCFQTDWNGFEVGWVGQPMQRIVSVVVVLVGLLIAIKLIFGFAFSLLWTLGVGLVIGGVASQFVKQENSVGMFGLALYGVAGSFAGKVVGGLLGLGWILSLALSVGAAAALIAALNGR